MKLIFVAFVLFLSAGHALAAPAPEMSKETEETIEEIFEQLIQLKGAINFPGNFMKYPLSRWEKHLHFYIDDNSVHQLKEMAILSLEEISSLAGISLTRVGLPSEADLVIVFSKKGNNDLRMDGRWGKILKLKIENYNDEPLDGDFDGMSIGLRSHRGGITTKFTLVYFLYSTDIEIVMQSPWKKYIKYVVYFSIMNNLVGDYKDSIFNMKKQLSCLTVADKIFVNLVYGDQFDQFLAGKLKNMEFENYLRERYKQINESAHGACE